MTMALSTSREAVAISDCHDVKNRSVAKMDDFMGYSGLMIIVTVSRFFRGGVRDSFSVTFDSMLT